MVNFAFSRELRLLKPNCFSFVFQQPDRASTLQITILGRLNALNHPRIGFSIARKTVKYAYERNRIKRVMRESFRLRQYKLPPMDFVVIAKRGISNLDNHAISKLLEKLWYHYSRLSYKD